MVAEVALPDVAVEETAAGVNLQVSTTLIQAKDNLVAFQGDFTFDERVVAFQDQPVQKAGVTGGNWNVSGNVLPEVGPIRTLRVSAFSNDLTPLVGSGILFELRTARLSKAGASTSLNWVAAPDQFFFIDADLGTAHSRSGGPWWRHDRESCGRHDRKSANDKSFHRNLNSNQIPNH